MMDCVLEATLRRKGSADTPSPLISITSAAVAAPSEGPDMTAMPTSAAARAGASFMPSPTWVGHQVDSAAAG